jgi:pimeloyl-ACP methyl ester carboxylesterase
MPGALRWIGKMRRGLGPAAVVLLAMLTACHPPPPPPDPSLAQAPQGPFVYPWEDPIVATVVGTPPALRAPLPETIPVTYGQLQVLPEREIPEVFFYQRGLVYVLHAQPGEAPLVVLIPGTGAGPTAHHVDVLSRIFYAGGYHVLALPSPTFPNFVVTASATGVPGRVERDARDFHRALRHAVDEVRHRIAIRNDDISLVGYSLGGWHAAFVGWLDDNEAERPIGFRRVLLINPPVNLYSSSKILDAFIDKIPGGISGLPVFFEEVFKTLSSLYTASAGPSDLTGDYLYQAYVTLRPSRDVLAALIGLVFRLSSTDLTFTADVIGKVGYLVPPEKDLQISTSLTPYLVTGLHYGFTDYLRNLLYPYYRQFEPDLTIEELVEEADLKRIGGYLATNPRYRLITNADEIINSPAELAFLQDTFAGREKIFPRGGHCGNFQHPQVVAAMLDALAEGGP